MSNWRKHLISDRESTVESRIFVTEAVYNNLPFEKQLSGYFRRFCGDTDLPSRAAANFVKAVNANLPRGGNTPPLTESVLKEILAGGHGLTQELLTAFTATFSSAPHMRFYRQEREDFIAAAAPLLEREQKWRMQQEQRRQQYRKTNPPGQESKPSFQEILQESVKNNEGFISFFFDRLMPSWNQSQLSMAAHIGKLASTDPETGQNLPPDPARKDTLTDTVMSQWKLSGSKPNRESVGIICRAFRCVPAKGKLISREEQLLWRLIGGHRFCYTSEGKALTGNLALKAAITDAQNTGNHGSLLTALINASGIPLEHIETLLDVSQINPWRRGQKIGDLTIATRLIDMLDTAFEGDRETKASLKRQCLGIFTGRDFEIDHILSESAKAGNPGGDLLIRLTGRKGLVPFSAEELSTAITARNILASADAMMQTGSIPVTRHTIGSAVMRVIEDELKRRAEQEIPAPSQEALSAAAAEESNIITASKIGKSRGSTQMERGGFIDERLATSLVAIVSEKMQHLIDQGIATPLTEEQTGLCIDTLCNCPHPRTMLAESLKGEYNRKREDSLTDIGDITRRTYERKGLTQEQFMHELGVSHISDFILGKNRLNHDNAKLLADWYKKNYDIGKNGRRNIRCMALAVDRSMKPEEILNAAKEGTMPRHTALQRLYDLSGLTREDLAATAKVAAHVIQRSTTEISGGRLHTNKDEARRIAIETGIPSKRLDEFAELFTSPSRPRGPQGGAAHTRYLAKHENANGLA